jgi:ribonuclease P protein component
MRAGRAYARPAFALHALAAPGENRALGIICGRRVGNAVARNRVKRRLREIFRTAPAYFRPGWWFVVAARPPITTLPFADLARELNEGLAALTAGGPDARNTRAQ